MIESKMIFICDCCKKEVSNENDLIQVKLPYQVAENTTSIFVSWKMIDEYRASKKFDICQDCAKKIVEGYKTQNIELGDYPYQGWTFKVNDNE